MQSSHMNQVEDSVSQLWTFSWILIRKNSLTPFPYGIWKKHTKEAEDEKNILISLTVFLRNFLIAYTYSHWSLLTRRIDCELIEFSCSFLTLISSFFSLCSLKKITEEKSEINVTWDGSNHLEFSIKKCTQNLNFKNIKNWIKSKQSIKSGSSVLNFQYYACQLNRYHSVYSSPPH